MPMHGNGLAVKPSAKPTLVRTQHLPPPAKTARELGFLGSRAIALGAVRSRCVHGSPAGSGCARTYSGQRPGRYGGPPTRISAGCACYLGDRLRVALSRWKIIGGSRSGPRIAHGIRRLVLFLRAESYVGVCRGAAAIFASAV